jgi:hypothetical protein
MNARFAFFCVVSLLGAAGCAGEQGHAEDAHHFKGPLGDFHNVLAPIWHSDPGAGRVAKACDGAKLLNDRAAGVDGAAPPVGADVNAYKTAARQLSMAVSALSTACGASGRPEVEAKLSAVHDAFHKVAEASGAHEHH